MDREGGQPADHPGARTAGPEDDVVFECLVHTGRRCLGLYGVFAVQHLPQPGAKLNQTRPSRLAFGEGGSKTRNGNSGPDEVANKKQKTQICAAPPARRRARPVRWNGLEWPDSFWKWERLHPSFVRPSRGMARMAQHSAVTARNGAERLAGPVLAPASLGASSAPALPFRARGARKLVWDLWVQPLGTLSIPSKALIHFPVPFTGVLSGAPASPPLPPSAQRDSPPGSCRLNHPPVLLLFLRLRRPLSRVSRPRPRPSQPTLARID